MMAAMAQQIARALGVKDENALKLIGRVAEDELRLVTVQELPGGGMDGALRSAKTGKQYRFRIEAVTT
jgi:hypothetical protein